MNNLNDISMNKLQGMLNASIERAFSNKREHGPDTAVDAIIHDVMAAQNDPLRVGLILFGCADNMSMPNLERMAVRFADATVDESIAIPFLTVTKTLKKYLPSRQCIFDRMRAKFPLGDETDILAGLD